MGMRKRLLVIGLLAASFAFADCRMTDVYVEYQASQIKLSADKPGIVRSPVKTVPPVKTPKQQPKYEFCPPGSPCMHRLTKVA